MQKCLRKRVQNAPNSRALNTKIPGEIISCISLTDRSLFWLNLK